MESDKLERYRQQLAEECFNRTEHLISGNGEEDDFLLERHQQDGMLAAAAALEGGIDRFSIIHAGGSGKTVLEAGIVQASRAAKASMNGDVTGHKDLILTVERSLITSVRDHIVQLIGDDNVGMWGMGKKELEPDIIVANIQALQHCGGNFPDAIDPSRVSLIVGDEADKFLTARRRELLDQFENAIRIGFTATPRWSDGRHINQAWGEIIDRLSLRGAIERGVNVDAFFLLFEANIIGRHIPVVRRDFDYDKAALAAAMKYVQIEESIPHIYRDVVLSESNPKEFPTLVYVPSVQVLQDTENALRQAFERRGITISSWHGKMTNSRLSNEMEAFQNGEIDILVLCEMGGRGLNLPRARCIIDAYPTLSANKLEQRHSRTLRRIRPGSKLDREDFQKPDAVIVQIIPKSNAFRPITLLDVLDGWQGWSQGGRGVGGRSTGHPSEDRIGRIVERLRLQPITPEVTLLEEVDSLMRAQRYDEVPEADDNDIYYE